MLMVNTKYEITFDGHIFSITNLRDDYYLIRRDTERYAFLYSAINHNFDPSTWEYDPSTWEHNELALYRSLYNKAWERFKKYKYLL